MLNYFFFVKYLIKGGHTLNCGTMLFLSKKEYEMKRFLWALAVLSVLPAYANDPQVQVNEQAVAMCMVVTSGVYNVAVEHQKGTSKQKTQRQLERDIQQLSKRFSDKNFVGFVGDSWKKGLDIIYTMPVQNTKEDKEAFISQVVDTALVACLDDLGA